MSGAVVPNPGLFNRGLALAKGTESPENPGNRCGLMARIRAEPIISIPNGPPAGTSASPERSRSLARRPHHREVPRRRKPGCPRRNLRLSPSRTPPGLGTDLLALPDGADIDVVLSGIKSDPNVLYAEPDSQVFASGAAGANIPSDVQSSVAPDAPHSVPQGDKPTSSTCLILDFRPGTPHPDDPYSQRNGA